MQERSRGSKRFEVGDVPTRASIYQEDQTPAHWPPPTDANARRGGATRKPRSPRNGLIASQLGLPTQTRAPAQSQHYPPDSWQTQAAADGDWPLDDYHAAGSGEPYTEYATYDEDAELQASLDLDNSQGLYEEQLGAYYAAANPPLDLHLPPVAAQQHDYQAYAQAYAEPWNQEDLVTSHYTRPGFHAAAAQPAPAGKYPFAQVARQSSQPSAAKWQTQQPIQRVTTPARGARAQAHAAPGAHHAAANPYAPAAAARANAQSQVQNARARATAGQPKPNAQTNSQRQLARNAPSQLRNAPAQGGRSAQARKPNSQAQNANAQARNPPSQRNRTANAHFNHNASAHARNGNTPIDHAHAHNAASQLNRTANANFNHTANPQLNRTASAQFGRTSAPRFAARSFVDDLPVTYPKARGSGWFKTFVFLICIGAGAYAARDQIAPSFLTTPAPRPLPTPVAPPAPAPVIAEPTPPAPSPAPEASAAPAPEATSPLDDAKARRSAARAAIIAERWRERRAARLAQGDDYDNVDARPDPTPTPSEPAQTPRYTPKPPAQPGTLRINSRPWSNIFVDGQPVGHTPQMNLQLPSGQHQITLINNEMQLRKAINVTITPGETTTQTVNLAE